MKSVKTEFPNPVLASGRDDYIDSCSFSTFFNTTEITVNGRDIVIPLTYSLVCKGLQLLIDTEQAVVVVLIKSSAASYRRLFRFSKDSTRMEIRIPKFDVVNRIEIAGTIIAQTAIKGFKCDEEFNELYFQNATFEIRKGDVLAREDSRVIYIDDSELEKPLSSIFNINNGHDQEDQVVSDFSGEKIEITLCEPLYQLYHNFIEFNNGALRRYVTGIIVYPVLVEAIAKIFESKQIASGEEDHKRWFRAIELKAEERGFQLSQNDDSSTTLANILLGDISLDALQRMKDVLESELNSGEPQNIGGTD